MYHLFSYTSLPYSDTAIRKLLSTGRCVYVGGTKAMHRFTSRTPRVRFTPWQEALWSSRYSRRLNRTDLSGNRRIFRDRRIIIREHRSFWRSRCRFGQSLWRLRKTLWLQKENVMDVRDKDEITYHINSVLHKNEKK